MSRPINEKLVTAFCKVCNAMEDDYSMTSSKHYFHRTKKYAFSVMAERLDDEGWLPGEKEFSKQ